MDIAIAYDLKADHEGKVGGPDDRLEEYDSSATVEAIAAALRARGHAPRPFGGGRGFLERMLAAPPELVFNIAEGFGSRSREAHVPSVCEMLGVPVTHSDPLTLAVTLDKAIAKRLVAAAGVATPRYAIVESARHAADLPLAFPVIAKPLFEGSSIGIRAHSKLADRAALDERVGTLLAHYREPVLVEEFCPGAEFTVAVLGSGAGARVVGAMEIAPKQVAVDAFVYSLERKRSESWREEIDYRVPPRADARARARIEAVALEAYRALGCRDVARVDLRTGRDGEPQFIEANPLPGVAPGWSDLALLWERVGRTYDDLIGSILDEARARLGLR